MSVSATEKKTGSLYIKSFNGSSVALEEIPVLSEGDFNRLILSSVSKGLRVSSYFGVAENDSKALKLYVVLADDTENSLKISSTEIHAKEFLSLTPQCPQVHLFEREIAEQFGVKPVNHPWLKPVRYNQCRTSDQSLMHSFLGAVEDFYKIEGEQVHEVAVGPVHAGIIEPGHFRFQCHGEEVFHLEIALGYQHRGIERALQGEFGKRSLHYAENIAGDSAIGHGSSLCQIVESLSDSQQSARALAIRGIALELERVANHVGDLGALSGDVGFLPTASFCGRIRGDFLNMTAVLCGNRFGRGLLKAGGVRFDLQQPHIDDLLRRLDAAEKDVSVAVNLLWDTPSVMARFENTGTLTTENAVDLGLVGPSARACGLMRDIRHDHSSGIFCFSHIPVATCKSGDVFARASVRWLEIQYSLQFIREQLVNLPGGKIHENCGKLKPHRLAVSLIEGWRGEICHTAITDENGNFLRYKIVDPSFHNWTGLAIALRNQQISDFPLCNKSFNLSYCGHDL